MVSHRNLGFLEKIKLEIPVRKILFIEKNGVNKHKTKEKCSRRTHGVSGAQNLL